MKTITVGELKKNFSAVLEWINSGEEVVISFGKKKKIVASIVPAPTVEKNGKSKDGNLPGRKALVLVAKGVRHAANTKEERPLGLLAGKATVAFADNFKMTEEEFLGV